jgi:transketolase
MTRSFELEERMNDKLMELKHLAAKMRRDIILMVGVGQPGHIGGSCSSADIVAVLYGHKMKHDPKNPKWEGRDKFLMSKGHAAIIQYAALAEQGYFPTEALPTLKKFGSMLQGHPDIHKTPGIEANTGSLGQGLSIANGLALAMKLDKKPNRVYCILGDGELAEGQVWEAAMFAGFRKIDNIVAIIDRNSLGAMGCVAERMSSNPLPDKWVAFGWNVIEIDGHNMEQIIDALDKAETVKGKPTAIIAQTIKGKGFSFAENNVAFHNGAMTQAQYDLGLKEANARLAEFDLVEMEA